MYIRRLSIKRGPGTDVAFSFTRNDEPRMWTVLVGADAATRRSVLQAIALSVAGTDEAGQLAGLPAWPDGPAGDLEMDASLEFGADPSHARIYPGWNVPPGNAPPSHLRSELMWEPGLETFVGSSNYVSGWSQLAAAAGLPPSSHDPLQQARTQKLPRWFVAGYGRERENGSPDQAQPLPHPLASLFARGSALAPALLAAVPARSQYLATVLRAVVGRDPLAPEERVSSLLEGTAVTRSAGATTGSEPDWGFVTWVADVIGRAFIDEGAAIAPSEMRGLVLVEDLDLHVPPELRNGLIPRLRTLFPHIQFVVTAEAPVVLSELELDEILLLQPDGRATTAWGSLHEALPISSRLDELRQELADMTKRTPTGALDGLAYQLPVVHRSMSPDRLLNESLLAAGEGSRNRGALGIGGCTFFWVGSCAYEEGRTILVWTQESEEQPPAGLAAPWDTGGLRTKGTLGRSLTEEETVRVIRRYSLPTSLYRSYLSMVLEVCFQRPQDYRSGRRPGWYPGLYPPPIPDAEPPARTFELRRPGSVPIAPHLVAVIPDPNFFANDPGTLRGLQKFAKEHGARWIDPQRNERPHEAARRFVADFLRERGVE